MEYKKRYREVFSQVRPMKEFDPEELCAKRSYRGVAKKAAGIAAALVLLAGLGLTAYAANLFGLRDMLLPQQEVNPPIAVGNTENEQQSEQVDMISLTGYGNTPESKAVAEWQAFLSAYDQDGTILESLGSDPTGFEEEYGLYLVYTQEMADKLDEITAKYALKRHTAMLDDLYTDEALCDQVGGDFMGENRACSTYMYEDGTFKFDGEIDLEGYGTLNYQFLRCVRGSFTDIILNITNVNDYTEWGYITKSGVPVTLALSPHKALIIADLPDSFVTVNVLAGTQTPTDDVFSSGPFLTENLERLADSFDFGVLTPARPANPDLPRPTLEEVLGAFTAEEFSQIAGIEEPDAQRFFASFADCVEADDRQSVAEMLCYPAEVTWWSAAEAETHLVCKTVESAEEFLPLYDEIFTEELWWNGIMANRYDKERFDLIAETGMVGAAGGAIWFMPTADGIRIMSVQNGEGGSFQIVEQPADMP